MKQSPFKFQGNNSTEARRTKTKESTEAENKAGQPALSHKNLKKAQSRPKTTTHIRTGKPQGGQRPKGGG